MADYPCDWHLARYKGPSTRIYLNCYRDDQELKLKGSVCGACFDELLTDWASRALHQTESGDWDPGEEAQDVSMLWKRSVQAVDARFGRRTA